ncbi:MAG: TusE/DsrC/DsvC family sulfur relay protein [Terracidiphilus sp.]
MYFGAARYYDEIGIGKCLGLYEGKVPQKEHEMAVFVWHEIEVPVDEDGFIQEPERWNEDLATALAATDGVQALTIDHWKVINYIRSYYREFDIAPMIRKLCKETGFTLRQIYELFPSGPAKGACKVAGLPKPTGCV